jgi:1,5-anhydro-D-fructose reductase (1,5-anhydro-D-mannitol-forming)
MAEAQPTAVASPTKERAQRLAEEYGIRAVFCHHADLLASEVDAVIVATPNHTHYQIVKDALEAGKDVLVEYPMVLQSEHAMEIVRLREEKEAVVEVGFDTRFHPLDRKLREAVSTGRIGKPLWCGTELLYRVDYEPKKWYWQQEATRGMIISWLVERFDLLRRLCGEVESVFALQAPEVYAGEGVFQQQTCVVNLQFQSGAVGVVSASCLAPSGFPTGLVQVLGTEGGLWCDLIWQGRTAPTLRLFTSSGEESVRVEAGWDTLSAETAHFVQCVRERISPENPPAESLAALQVAEAALGSLRNKRASRS